MTIKSRVIAEDGLTVVERIDDNTDLSAATPTELERWTPGGFKEIVRDVDAFWLEELVRDVEKFWRAHVPATLTTPVPPLPLTRPWYARRILPYIERLRTAIAQDASLEKWVLLAMDLGTMTKDAEWRFNRGASTRLGANVRTKKRAAGRRSGARRRAQVFESNQLIKKHAQQIRRSYPRTREHSTRWLAIQIARRMSRPVETIRTRLVELAIQ